LDLFGDPIKRKTSGPVADKFGFPPFSVLDARQGDWQERKRAWASLGIESEVARPDTDNFIKTQDRGEYWQSKMGDASTEKNQGTSIFDPTLCECIYRWFSAEGGQVVDPFAGGSVRGIVAAMTGRRYWGCDLRQEQVEANNAQADEIKPEPRPVWVCGDSMETLAAAPDADLVFSCPPYGDLEKYSDDPSDLSAMEWHTFKAAYSRIILRAVKRLKQDRFACFVVGDFRDNRGFYRDFVSGTIEAFRSAGAELYNEAILVTSVGSASMRVTKQFNAGRKFAKTHQNILVFCKGDWRKAADSCKAESDNREDSDGNGNR
jgi:DNA modification methylase